MKLQTLFLAAIFALALAATATAAEAPSSETARPEAAISTAAPAGVGRAWGDDAGGQLGDGGTNTSQPTPVTVSGLATVTAIAAGAAGGAHSLALLSDGTVRAWGYDLFGQLGDGGTNTDQPTPVAVSGLATVTAIAAGGNHSLALLSDGTVRAWGYDGEGQLGDGGTNTEQPTPVAVSGLATVTAIAAGGAHSLALLSDGTVRAWGDDLFGQLGDGGTNTDQPTPVAVSGLTAVTAIAAGGGHSLALLSDGTVRAWGLDSSGQLGDGGTNTDQPTPVAVSGL
ncbi:MAG: RCC1 repeat-containing protein, partial [Dehalococcoidia bacterium]